MLTFLIIKIRCSLRKWHYLIKNLFFPSLTIWCYPITALTILLFLPCSNLPKVPNCKRQSYSSLTPYQIKYISFWDKAMIFWRIIYSCKPIIFFCWMKLFTMKEKQISSQTLKGFYNRIIDILPISRWQVYVANSVQFLETVLVAKNICFDLYF